MLAMWEQAKAGLRELERCRLCHWQCGVNRLQGERGVCMLTLPQVASYTLHPAPPSSFTIFFAGCNFRCLHCQNWTIATWPDSGERIVGLPHPRELAAHAVRQLSSPAGRAIEADRIFFSGGEPTCALPYIEQVVFYARQIEPDVRFNFDTNGFIAPDNLRRVLEWTTSVTFDLRAVDDEVHRAMTGAPAGPVLENARLMAEHPEKLWEFRILVIPGINDGQIEKLCRFVAELNPNLPVCFLAFRPNFVLDAHPGAPLELMRQAVEIARDCGLRDVHWAGLPGLPALPGAIWPSQGPEVEAMRRHYKSLAAALAGAYAARAGCNTHPRLCGDCPWMADCKLRRYRPRRVT